MVFLEFPKVFDRVWRRGLIFKLKPIGIDDILLEWISDYLIDRKQKAIIRNS